MRRSVLLALIIAGIVLGTKGAMAPLIVLVWLALVNRMVVSTGHIPSPAGAVAASRLGWLMLASAVAATAASVLNLLLPLPVFPGIATVAAGIAGVLALADAWLTARAMRAAQVPEAPDMTPFTLIQGVFGITDLALSKYIENGSLTAVFQGEMLHARIPVGPDALLEDRAALDARVALKASAWMVAFADPATDELILEPVDDETRARRDAALRSGGLFAEALGGGLDDLETIDLGLSEPELPRLS